jgi:hypothetical protein
MILCEAEVWESHSATESRPYLTNALLFSLGINRLKFKFSLELFSIIRDWKFL